MNKVFCASLAVFLLFASSAMSQQQMTCKEFEGKYTGAKEGAGYVGPLTIIFQADCSYEWVGSSGRVTLGKLDIKTDKVFYANTAGSRGVVKKSANELMWRNDFTGANYIVKVKKVD